MTKTLRAAAVLVAACLSLATAASALAADRLNLTRFSKAVSGNTGGASNTVTVNLLRNTVDPATGVVTRNQIDTFTTTADAGGAWAGSFARHAFATGFDSVEVVVSGGTGAPSKLTVGQQPLPDAGTPPNRLSTLDPSSILDGNVSVSSDGKTLDASGAACPTSCDQFSLSVDGGASTVSASGTYGPATSPPLGTTLTNQNGVALTVQYTDAGGATITFTDGAPLLTPVALGDTPPVARAANEPNCTLYAVTREVGCTNLSPGGSYSLSQLRGAAAVTTQTLTVPARSTTVNLLPRTASSTPFAAIASGDQFVLKAGSRTLTTLTASGFTINALQASGDALNRAPLVVGGTCDSGLPLGDGSVCPAGGMIPPANSLAAGSLGVSVYFGGGTIGGGGGLARELDETGAGGTEIDLPNVAAEAPYDNSSVHDPFTALALVRFNDPAAVIANQNAAPAVGNTPRVASLPSSAPVALSVAPDGSSSFLPVGNVNVPGGLPLPALTPGRYVARFALSDGRGDTYVFDNRFAKEASPPTPAPLPPGGPAATRCSARSVSGPAATAAAKKTAKRKARKKAKKRTKRPAVATVTLTCAAPAGARVAAWVERGATVLADGSSGSSRGPTATVPLSGKLARGRYRLVELIELAGQATESTQTLTVR